MEAADSTQAAHCLCVCVRFVLGISWFGDGGDGVREGGGSGLGGPKPSPHFPPTHL